MLDALYSGEYQGIDIKPPDSKDFHETMDKFHMICEKLNEKLEKEDQELLDELLVCKNLLQADESREYYMQGFSAGVMLMVDIIQQYRRFIK